MFLVRVSGKDKMTIRYQEQSNLAFMLLGKSQKLNHPLKLEDLMSYPLTPVSGSIGTQDGFLYKTNKASLMHVIAKNCPDDLPYPENDCLSIEDGNALVYTLSHLPPTFGEICLQLLDIMVTKRHFIFTRNILSREWKDFGVALL